MPPYPRSSLEARVFVRRENNFGDWRDVNQPEAYILEGWGEGFMLGALMIMAVITLANMRKGVLLHKLILLELLLAMLHGTFGFMAFNGSGWYLSSTAALLYCSYFTHNVVAWLKISPFFTGPNPSFRPGVCYWVKWIYLSTLVLTVPAIIFEIFNNFRFFNNISELYKRVRPYEPLMRDPWWIFSCFTLFHVIGKCYDLRVFKMIRKSPRFGILLAAILLAIVFTTMDVLASIISNLSETDGINPYWKLALVFKCLTDNIMLDDFKSVLQRLGAMKLDGINAMQQNSLNIPANEKAGYTNDDYDVAYVEELQRSISNHRTNGRLRERGMSLSGRLLEDGEDLDDHGPAHRKQSLAVGKLGVKIRRLPRLCFSKKSDPEHEARLKAQRNKNILDLEMMEMGAPRSEASTNETHHSQVSREPWDDVDLIMAVSNQTLESPKWKR